MKPARLLLGDDHALILTGIRTLLEPYYEVVGSAGDQAGDHWELHNVTFNGINLNNVDDLMNRMIKAARHVNAKI